jgi:hypothetical protein
MKVGEISKSMGVDSKPSHKLNINGYWVLIDGKMPKEMFKQIQKDLKLLKYIYEK